ncbi:hypothetical protein QBC34DRAFT_399717 [Podospora aff. communis PSN243]|uniref:Uncharacterized protein n=1 Tax=Podospora aff. communis PSN243 TaxID=3040156 RepID=A0AAV9GVV6_9PEZI|nr:hypothetical protein QBC34DRAFT_399717 [Podospora aff. communis PSN243]
MQWQVKKAQIYSHVFLMLNSCGNHRSQRGLGGSIIVESAYQIVTRHQSKRRMGMKVRKDSHVCVLAQGAAPIHGFSGTTAPTVYCGYEKYVRILLQVITASWTPRKWGTRDDGFKQGH